MNAYAYGMGKLDTAYGSFSELIQQGKTFAVPRYQRKYSWRSKHEVAQLWQDIRQLYTAVQKSEKVDGYFIGPVVIGATPAKALGSVLCPVIDGQQRLITLSLVICALRDALVDDDDRADKITERYLGSAGDLRVLPGEHDRLVFEQLILSQEVTDKASSVYRAYDYLVTQMRDGSAADEDLLPDDDGDESIPDIADAEQADEAFVQEAEEVPLELHWEPLLSIVGTQLFLVSIDGVPSENAYQIFASLNHKGMQLAQVDLIRNAVFMLLPENLGADAYEKVWVPLEKAMDETVLARYLHTWVMRRGHNIPAKDTYRSFLSELSAPGMKPKAVRKILDDLFHDAWAYLLITDPTNSAIRKPFLTHKAPVTLVQALDRLRAWGSIPMEPLLMEVVGRWLADRLSPQATTRLLADLESFVIRRFIASVPPNDLRSSFGRLVRQVNSVEDDLFEGAVRQALCEGTRRWPTDSQLTEAMATEHLYRNVGLGQTFFVLRRIAEELQGKEHHVMTHGTKATDYSIEHILPQGTGGGLPEVWQKDLAAWHDPDPIETWTTRTHVIGNLTLTAYNSELSNKPFDEKKAFIEEHLMLALSRGILDYDQWGRGEIDARSAALAKVAIKVWPRPK